MADSELDKLLQAARAADWQQVVFNGGQPCFHLSEYDGLFCLRAKHWAGHGGNHKFVSFEELLRRVADES